MINTLDIIICIPLVWGAFRGFRKGFIIEVFSLLALILGIYGALSFSDLISKVMAEDLGLETRFLPVIAFAATLLGVIIGVFVLGKALEKIVNLLALKFVNKLLGSLFSVLKTGLVLGALLLVLKSVDQRASILPKRVTENSLLYHPITNTIEKGIPLLNELDLLKGADSGKLLSLDEFQHSSPTRGNKTHLIDHTETL